MRLNSYRVFPSSKFDDLVLDDPNGSIYSDYTDLVNSHNMKYIEFSNPSVTCEGLKRFAIRSFYPKLLREFFALPDSRKGCPRPRKLYVFPFRLAVWYHKYRMVGDISSVALVKSS
jgi:hypothetical protein